MTSGLRNNSVRPMVAVIAIEVSDDHKRPLRMLKRPLFSPAQPRCAETHRSAGKVAASEEALCFQLNRFVEPLNDARTPLCEGPVSARRR